MHLSRVFAEDDLAAGGKVNARHVGPETYAFGDPQFCDPPSIDLVEDRDAVVASIGDVNVPLVHRAVVWIIQKAFGRATHAMRAAEYERRHSRRNGTPVAIDNVGLRPWRVQIHADNLMVVREDDK